MCVLSVYRVNCKVALKQRYINVICGVNMERQKQINNELHVGPQINCPENIESIEIHDNTNIVCNCSKVTNVVVE